MKPRRIILHHSLTKDSDTVSWGAIRDFHINHNGWSDIGYHFGIENLRGSVEILSGRMPDVQGAHCKWHNFDSIGICFVGNFDVVPPPNEKLMAGVKLCRYLVRQFGIEEIVGHRDINKHKTCPGKMFDIARFRRDVFL